MLNHVQSNQPIDRFDTKLNYNTNPFNENTFTFDYDLNNQKIILLDSFLRVEFMNQIRFSQNFSSNTSFVIQPQ